MDLLKYRDKIEGKKKVEAYIAKMKKQADEKKKASQESGKI